MTKRKAADDIVILQLFRASSFNDFLSVDIYSDGEAEAKNKPLNIRARAPSPSPLTLSHPP